MKRLNGLLTVFMMTSLVAAVSSMGCREETAAPTGATAKSPAQPTTPEESFALIYETFRRGIETGRGGTSGGFIATDEDGHSRLTVNNSVSREFFPPANDSEPYRATITVVSEASYSIARGLGDEEESETEEGEEASTSEETALPLDETTGVLDPSLISTGNGTDERADTQDMPVARRDDREERKFDLVYENRRWRLTEESQKKLDPKTERAIINAFEMALRKQA